METTQLLWRMSSTAWLSSWWKKLSLFAELELLYLRIHAFHGCSSTVYIIHFSLAPCSAVPNVLKEICLTWSCKCFVSIRIKIVYFSRIMQLYVKKKNNLILHCFTLWKEMSRLTFILRKSKLSEAAQIKSSEPFL